MPTIPQGGLVLVTGASGYLAVHVIDSLLHHGFSVRGTVRSKAKGEFLADLYKGKKFEYVVVPDMQHVSIRIYWVLFGDLTAFNLTRRTRSMMS
jgi:uncharacterized protein YbjT (DUF2867 family)